MEWNFVKWLAEILRKLLQKLNNFLEDYVEIKDILKNVAFSAAISTTLILWTLAVVSQMPEIQRLMLLLFG